MIPVNEPLLNGNEAKYLAECLDTGWISSETLFITRGRLRVNFFDDQQHYLESRELQAGDAVLLVKGGHGFEVLEELEMFEVKQGPYAGDRDKTRFDGTSAHVAHP